MSDCHELEPLISAALDGELDDGELARLQQHLSSCAACRQLQTEWEHVNQLLPVSVWVPSPAHVERIRSAIDPQRRIGVLRRVAGLSAAAMILLALTVSWSIKPQPVAAEMVANGWETLHRIQRVQDHAHHSTLKTCEWDLRTLKLELENSQLAPARKSALSSRIEQLMQRVQRVQQDSLEQGV